MRIKAQGTHQQQTFHGLLNIFQGLLNRLSRKANMVRKEHMWQFKLHWSFWIRHHAAEKKKLRLNHDAKLEDGIIVLGLHHQQLQQRLWGKLSINVSVFEHILSTFLKYIEVCLQPSVQYQFHLPLLNMSPSWVTTFSRPVALSPSGGR